MSTDTDHRPDQSAQDAPAAPDTKAHDAALRAELDSLRRINNVVSGLNTSLDKAKSNMTTVDATVTHASALLESWTRILSRSEHNQRLILNPAWTGATADLESAEADARDRQRERARRDEAEARRREDAERRRVLDDERHEQAAAAAAATTPGTRGRGRGGRGTARGAGAGASAAPASTRGAPTTGRAAIARYGRVRTRGVAGAVAGRGRAGGRAA